MSATQISTGTTGVSAGTYTNASITVQNVSNDCRLSAASNGTAPTGTAPAFTADNATFPSCNTTSDTSLMTTGTGSLTLPAPVTGNGFKFVLGGFIDNTPGSGVNAALKITRGATVLASQGLIYTSGSIREFLIYGCVVNYSTTTCRIVGATDLNIGSAVNQGLGSTSTVTITNATATFGLTWAWTSATGINIKATNFVLWTF